jgi:sirohydrochlorin cobaltochelatase
MPNQTVLVVGHGSRVLDAIDQFHQFTDALSARVNQPVGHCFLELVDPDMATGLTDAAQRVGDGGEVIVLPLFLGAAGHQKNDVAASIQWGRAQFPSVAFRYSTSLGPHAKLVELLDLRVRQALETEPDALSPGETFVLVVGRGSSDPTSNSEIARSAYLLFEKHPYLSVEYAYQAVARPKVDEGVHRCKLLGARQVVVAPYILFTGKVEEDIRHVSSRMAAELGLRALHAQHLGIHPLLLDVAEQRLQEAIDGTASMSCDLCKYRWPMAGYEHQVGQPQITHHLHGGSARRHSHDHHHEH